MLEQSRPRRKQSAILEAPYVVRLPALKRLRLEAALSQRDLAQRSGVAASTIARIESGEQAHPSTTRKLAKALNCDPVDLMSVIDREF